MSEKNLVTWNEMAGVYAHRGDFDMPLGLFVDMALLVCGISLSYVTLSFCIVNLSASSGTRAMERGVQIFKSMSDHQWN